MPKRTNILPNLRVDVADFENAAHTYPRATIERIVDRFIQDNLPRIATGFRVEIADQGTAPGQFTVYNGIGIDSEGAILNNEDQENASRTQTLTGSATYYIEVEFTTTESDSDGRAFWDPTFDNGTDASGDVLPDGREFNQAVATRVSEDWQIVTPIATAPTGFDVDSNLNTTRIPVAILTTIAGSITDPASTTTARTTVLEDAIAGVVSLKLVNTRLFPDAGDIQIDPGGPNDETVGYTANDRRNGVLTLGPTASPHVAGERVVDAEVTPLQFVEERQAVNPPVPTGTGIDARPRYWQGNPDYGYALSQDPDNDPGNSDIQISTLKNYIDFLAAQIREMKFGAARDAEVGDTAPPTTFAALPGHYDNSGGLAGSRAYTVSVGDGANTWGDFNSVQSGSAQAAIAAALTAAGSTGVVFIKQGTYDVASLTVSQSIVLQGEPGTIINATSDEAVQVSGSPSFRDITFTVTTATHRPIGSPASAFTGSFYRCTIAGANFADALDGLFEDCTFTGSSFTGAILQAVSSAGLVMNRCTFNTKTECIDFSGTAQGITIRDCTFTGVSNATTGMINAASLSGNVSSIVDCRFLALPAQGACIRTTGTISDISVQGCVFSAGIQGTGSQYGFQCQDVTSNSLIANSTFTGVEQAIVSDGYTDVRITDNLFQDNTGSSYDMAVGVAFDADGGEIFGLTVVGNVISNITGAISNDTAFVDFRQSTLSDVNRLNVSNNVLRGTIGADANAGDVFFVATERLNDSVIANNIADIINGRDETYGVYCTGPVSQLSISDNSFGSIGTISPGAAGGNQWAMAIRILDGTGITINGNVIGTVGSTSNTTVGAEVAAISVGSLTEALGSVSINNNRITTMRHGDAYRNIYVAEAALINVIGNQIVGNDDANEAGIRIESDTANTIKSVSVIGNQILSSYDRGIVVDFTDSPSSTEGRIIIADNTVQDWENDGIFVNTAGSTRLCSVTGNVMETTRSQAVGSAGIDVEEIINLAIANNVITFFGGGVEFGIDLLAGYEHAAIVGNVIRSESNAGTFVGIRASSGMAVPTAIAGNAITCGTSSTATGIDGNSDVLPVGNVIDVTNATTGTSLTNITFTSGIVESNPPSVLNTGAAIGLSVAPSVNYLDE